MNPIRLSILAAALSSCAAFGGGRAMSRGPEAAAAEGEVSFRKLPGRITAVEVRVKNLREPERLSPPGYAYVAWLRGRREDPPSNLGLLNMREDLSGELRATTPLTCSELFITAEATADAERPTGRRLLWTACD
jgi:hypothetical protein